MFGGTEVLEVDVGVIVVEGVLVERLLLPVQELELDVVQEVEVEMSRLLGAVLAPEPPAEAKVDTTLLAADMAEELL